MSENKNRAFFFGESVFTTMKMVNGEVLDWEMHYERLRLGVEFVYGPFEDKQDWNDSLRARLDQKLAKESGSKILRLTLFRHQAGRILKHQMIPSKDLEIDLQFSEMPQITLGSKVKLRSCLVNKRPEWWPSFLKAGNYLETILSQKLFLTEHDTELVFLSSDGSILESSLANIFVLKNDQILTAPVGPNVLDGIVRKKVLCAAHDFFERINLIAPTLDDIKDAQGVFGTNSVRGLFLIDKINETEIHYSDEILKKIQKLRDRVSK